MINKWFCTGDTHGEFTRFYKLNQAVPEGEVWGVIILGDAGFNFWLTKREKKNQKRVCHSYPNLRFYCVRGNHEQRPALVENVFLGYDGEVQGDVWYDPDIPNIRYFEDGVTYQIGGYKTLVVGGAYSVDKDYRLARAAAGGYAGWFEGEQLTKEERDAIMEKATGQHYDLILAHTCPWEWMPRDLFLPFIDQTQVDNTMEMWLGILLLQCSWSVFLCGHYHDDRTLAPHAEMLSIGIKNLDDIMRYWED